MRILNNATFSKEFERCCIEYNSLDIASAWCGDPTFVFPYAYLNSSKINLKTNIITGISFNQTHPDAIKWFMDHKIHIRIFKKDVALFHPKIYLFKDTKKFALFIGSSNFTYSGFFKNVEINQFSEGELIGEKFEQVKELGELIEKWSLDDNSLIPTEAWLKKYQTSYYEQKKKEKESKIITPTQAEENYPKSNWFAQANWDLFLKKIVQGLIEKNRKESEYNDLLDTVKEKLPLPWHNSIFDDIENRRIIGGMGIYGWLGHVAAAGSFRKMMANGSREEKENIVKAINNICELSKPLDIKILKKNLQRLIGYGNTVKVWSRIFAILRPDLFCTVASPSVRHNLAKVLKVSQSEFETPKGYIKLLLLIHSCPWFNSPEPKNPNERKIWNRRVAFIDAIFY